MSLFYFCAQANANLNELAGRLKRVEALNVDLQRRVDELQNEVNVVNGENQRMNAELARLRVALNELTEKNEAFARDNKQLSGWSLLHLDFYLDFHSRRVALLIYK